MTQPNQANILIVDDIPENLKVLMSILTKQGYQARPAINGQVALTAAQESPPDLVLLDISMPDMDGYEVCRRLKAADSTHDIPVIFISARDETADIVKGFAVGGADYVTKPFRIEEVLARVNTHLNNRYFQKQLEKRNAELQEALDNIKTLKGMIPICVNCKKIREDKAFWQDVEIYVSEHSEAQFSHGVCPDCVQELYPEQYEVLEKRRQDVLAVLTELGQLNLSEIAAAIDVPESATLNRLQIMEEAGEVKRTEEDGESFFRLP